MKLYYKKGSNEPLEFICEVNSIEEAKQVILDFWNPLFKEQLGYEVPYIRTIYNGDWITFDYGRHTSFYYLYKGDE